MIVSIGIAFVTALNTPYAHHVVNLVVAFGFTDGTGTSAVDSSGNSNTGVLFNGTGWGAGKYGSGIVLDGVNDFVAVADSVSLDLGHSGTVEAWVKLDLVNRWNGVLAKGSENDEAKLNYAIEIDTGNRVNFILGNGSAFLVVRSATRLNAQEFYHLACTWDGTEVRIYVNGNLDGSVAQSLTPAANTSPLFVGQYGGNVDRLDGTIDEVRIYNVALPQADIQTDMNTVVEAVPDATPPAVSMVNPADGAAVSGPVALVATATDDRIVAGVRFLLDGAPLDAEDTIEPYSITWDSIAVPNGEHQLTALARDAAGNTTTSAPTQVTVVNPPRLVVTAPTAGAGLSGTTVDVTYDVVGDATGFAVDHVHLQIDGGPEIMDPPPLDGAYSLTNVPPGAHTLTGFLVRSDHSKIPGTDSTSVPFVMIVADAVPPSVVIASPADGASVTGIVTLSASATDNIAVAGVQFYIDGTPVGAEDLLAPYSTLWNAVGSGSHVVTASARDVSGNVTVSSPVTVIVASANDPALIGQWSSVMNWPLVAVHASLLPTGDVLMWDGWELPSAAAQIWTPSTNAFATVPVGAGVFCAAQALLADGRALVVGGHAGGEIGIPHTFTFDPGTEDWTRMADMLFNRWYPSATRLPDGRIVALSGQITPGRWADTPEIYDPVANEWTALGVDSSDMHDPEYPLPFLLPDGTIYVVSAVLGSTHSLDLAAPSWISKGPAPFRNGSAAMFRPGKLLMTGGGNYGNNPSRTDAATIDLTLPTPTWGTVSPMVHGRYQHNLVVLADGNVLAVGGATLVTTSAAVGTLPAELWNAATETWSTMAAMRDPRMYHSTALLLPDGRVLAAGGGRLGAIPSYPTAEIYSPPYLFRGPRPTVTNSPPTAVLGEAITIETPDAANISRIALVPMAAVTHTLNMNQTYVEVPFTVGSNSVIATLPASANTVPPGYYSLFVLNNLGVPAMAPNLRILPVADAGAPAVALTSPVNGATLSGISAVVADASDDLGVASVQFRLNGQNLGSADTTAPYSVVWNTSHISNGIHSLTAIATDTVGNVTESPAVAVTVANSAGPARTLGYTAIGVVTDSGYPQTVNAWRFVMPGETGVASSLSVYIAGPISAAPGNQFQAAIYADQGNAPGSLVTSSASQPIVANTWNTVPLSATLQPNTAYWLAYNTNGSAAADNSVRLDPGATGQMRWRSQPFGAWPSAFGASSGGVAYQGSIYVTYSVPVAGVPRLAFTAPVENATVSGNTLTVAYTIIGDVADSDVNHLHYRIDGGADLMELPPLDGTFAVTGLSSGPHTLTGHLVRADHSTIVGTEATPVHFTVVSGDPPRLVFTQPVEGATLAGSSVGAAYAILGDASGFGVNHVHYRVDSGVELMELAPLDGALTLTSLTPGTHSLTGYLVRSDHSKITGSDATPVGFSTAAPSDTSPPTVTLTSPVSGAVLSSTVAIVADAFDDMSTPNVQFQLDGQDFGAPDTTIPYEVTWNTVLSANGLHTIGATARDAAGNVGLSAPVTVTVSNAISAKTLGYDGIGAITDSGYRQSVHVWRVVMPNETGLVSSLSVYIAGPISAAPNNQFQVAIYGNQGSVPGALLTSSASQAIVPNAWNTVALSATLQPNTVYWLAYNTNGSTVAANSVRLDPGTSGQMRWRNQSFGTWPATFGVSSGGVAYKGSMYVTYMVQ